MSSSPQAQNEIKIVEGPNGEKHVRWGDRGYRVISLGTEAQDLPLPGNGEFLDGERVRTSPNVVVFTERSGGGKDFSAWFCEQLDARWALVRGSAWQRPLYRFGDGQKEISPAALAESEQAWWGQALQALDALGTKGTADERAAVLVEWGGQLKEPFHLLLRDLSGLDEEKALAVATALRIVRDSGACPQLRILIVSTAKTLFADTAERSGYLSLSHRFRLCGHGEAEIEALVAAYGLTLASAEVEREIPAETGGQPLLVQQLLGKLKEGAASSSEVTVHGLRRALRVLRGSLPAAAKHWCTDLKDILRKRPELVTALEAYVKDKTIGPAQFPPPAIERELFIAGWLRLNRLGRWGITSRIHADLARTVLDEIRG